MTIAPSTPIIVGAAAIQQRVDDARDADDALTLMRRAVENAAIDAGSIALLDHADVLFVPQGTWNTKNPAAVIAPRSPAIRSVVAEIGVLQQTVLDRACALVADGRAELVVVCGGEAKHRALRAAIDGIFVNEAITTGEPSERLQPEHEILARAEIERGLPVPARQYALIDTALRSMQGLTVDDHAAALAELWSGFSRVAASNPDAWSPGEVSAALLRTASATNAMVAWPYTKLHCSQWNVDQAAALIVTSSGAAERLGLARDRWVFAHAGVESNLMVPLTLRRDIHRAPSIAVAAAALQQHAGVHATDVEHLDLYSCFPAAVRVQAAELGLEEGRQLTVTGGMTFAGGPLNNYTLQAMVTMVRALRDDPGGRGLVTNISGMLTKFGLSLWSCSPPERPFAVVDVTEEARAATPVATFDAGYAGTARVISYTVGFNRGNAEIGIVIAETPRGDRVLATIADVSTMSSMTMDEWCGRDVHVDGAAFTG